MARNVSLKTIIDHDIMQTIFGNDQTAMCKYINNYIARTFEILEKIKTALTEKNSTLVLEYFHQLKGPSGSSGFKRIYQLCEDAEKNILNGEWSTAQSNCEKISDQLTKLKSEVVKLGCD